MATKEKEEKANPAAEENDGTHRGRTAEPFGHAVDPFVLTLSFHDSISEEKAGAMISAVLEAVDQAKGEHEYKRVTRGEPSFYRQTFKIAPDTYDWPESKESAPRGARVSADTFAQLAGFVQTVLGVDDLKAYAKRTGKSVDAVISETIARVNAPK